MYNNDKNIMYNGREWKIRVTFDNGQTFDENTICNFNINAPQDTSKLVGAVISRQLEIELLGSSDIDLTGNFKLELGLKQEDNTFFYMSLGQYWRADSIEQVSKDKIKITAFDPIIWLIGDEIYEEGGNSTEITTTDLKAHIEDKFGIIIDATIPEFTLTNPYKESYRNIIGYLAMICSSNTFFKHDSLTIKFVSIIPKEIPDLSLDPSTAYSLSFDRSNVSIKKVQLDLGDGFGYKRGDTTVEDEIVTLKMPFGNQLICDEIYNNLYNHTQEGFECKFMGHPCLELFDTVEMTDTEGKIHKVCVNGYKMSFRGGLVCEMTSQITKASNNTTNYVENTLRTKIKVEADRILSIVEAEYQKKEATLTVSASKENIVVVLDEDKTPSKTTEFSITFTVFKNKTNEEIPCVIKNVTLSDNNLTAEYSNTSPVLTLNANTDRAFTAEEGYIDCIIETTEGDVHKRLFWSTTVNTIENSLIVLSATTQMFTRENVLAEWTPSSITVTANCSLCELIGWKYSINNGTSFIDAVSGSNGLTIGSNTITIANDSNLFNDTKNVIIKALTDSGVTDSIAISQTGDTDMIYVLLSNENHTFSASSDGKAIPTSIQIEVMGYKGVDEAPVTIGSINNIPTGMSVSISGSVITVSVDNTFTKLNGTLVIPITCEGISFKKTFSYSLSVSGGRGVATVENYYLASSLKKGVTVDTEGWTLEVPELTLELPYLWNYEITTFTDNSTITTEPALIGTYAEDGRGIVSIVEYYLISAKKTGITIETSGWSTNIPTITAENKYLWNYEEITYSDDTVETTEPCIIGAYGDKGENASWVTIQASSQVFKMTKNKNTYTPINIKLVPTFNNSEYIKWQYSNDNGETYTDIISGSNGLTIDSNNSLTINNVTPIFTVDAVQFKVLGTNNTSDVITITRIKDGNDTFVAILDNENHTFTANYEGFAISQSIIINPTGYFGNEKVSITVGTITGLPTGMSATISNNNSKTPSITINVDTTMTSRNGAITIPIRTTYNGNTYSLNKQFSYALSLDGTPASSCKINTPSNVFLSDNGGQTYSPTTITFEGSFIECAFSKWQYLDTNSSTFKNVVSGEHGFTLSGNKLILAVTSDLFNEKGGAISIRLLSDKNGVYDTLTISKLVQIKDLAEDIENIRSEIEQTNHNWKASFSTANATNILFDGDFDKEISKCNWTKINSSSIDPYYATINAYPFYENHNSLNTSFKYNTYSGVVYSLDLSLKPNTDYVYQAYVYTDNADIVTTNESCPLRYWAWTGETPKEDNANTSEIIDYSQILYTGRYNLCYIHFKTKDIEGQTIKCRLFIRGQSNSSGNQAMISIREVCFRQRDNVAPYTGNSNEVIVGVTTIDMNGIQVEHTLVNSKTEMSADGFRIIAKKENNEEEVIAELSNEEQWTQLKVDKVFAKNLENIYEGDSNLYVDHSATIAGDGTANKPFNSFRQLADYLEATPVINKDLFITVRDPGVEINEQLHLTRLKGTGFIKITLEGKLVIRGRGEGQPCILLTQIPKWVWIVSGREFGSSTTGAVLCDAGKGHGIIAADVDRLEVDAMTISCANWGIKVDRTHLYTWHVDFGKCYNAVELQYQSLYYSSDDVGSCTDFIRLRSGSFAYQGSGTVRPQGNVQTSNGVYYSSNNNLTPTASTRFPSANPTPPPAQQKQSYTYSYNWTSHQTYCYAYGNWNDSKCKQGQYAGYGLRGGHMFFDMTKLRSEISGEVLDGNTITLTRANSGGNSGGAKVYINGSSCSSPSGTPSYGGQTLLGTLAWGETKTFTLPKAIAQGLKNGTYNSLAVYVNSSASDCYLNIVNCSITLKCKK